MAGSPPPKTPGPMTVEQRPGFFREYLADWFKLRKPGPMWESFLLGVVCVAGCFVLWWALTLGEEGEKRAIGPLTLPSPAETFRVAPELFSPEIDTISNTLVTLRRVGLGFLLAIAIGVPLGVLAGCF